MVNKMRGGPSSSVASPSAVATNAVRSILLGDHAAKDSVAHAALLLGRRRQIHDLIGSLGLPPERKREIQRFPVARHTDCNALVGLVIAKPPIGRARKGFAVQRD